MFLNYTQELAFCFGVYLLGYVLLLLFYFCCIPFLLFECLQMKFHDHRQYICDLFCLVKSDIIVFIFLKLINHILLQLKLRIMKFIYLKYIPVYLFVNTLSESFCLTHSYHSSWMCYQNYPSNHLEILD